MLSHASTNGLLRNALLWDSDVPSGSENLTSEPYPALPGVPGRDGQPDSRPSSSQPSRNSIGVKMQANATRQRRWYVFCVQRGPGSKSRARHDRSAQPPDGIGPKHRRAFGVPRFAAASFNRLGLGKRTDREGLSEEIAATRNQLPVQIPD